MTEFSFEGQEISEIVDKEGSDKYNAAALNIPLELLSAVPVEEPPPSPPAEE